MSSICINRRFAFVFVIAALMANRAAAFYNPQSGRWLSRDPIEERGGMNLAAFVANGVANRIDLRGLSIADWWYPGRRDLNMFWEKWSPKKRAKWFNNFRTAYGDNIRTSALRNCVPKALLASIIA